VSESKNLRLNVETILKYFEKITFDAAKFGQT
jgi:hypothetical protein